MSGKLAFVEFKEELAAFESQFADCKFVTTLPPAQVALSTIDAHCFSSREYFDKSSHESILNASVNIIKLLRPAFDRLDYSETAHCFERTCLFYLRFYLHYWLSQLELIDNAVKAIKPDKLLIQPSSDLEKVEAPISREDKLLGDVVRAYARVHGIETRLMLDRSQARKKRSRCYGMVQKWIFGLFLILYRIVSIGRKSMFAPTDTNNMSALMDKLSFVIRDGLPVYFTVPRKSLKLRIKELICLKSFFFPFLPSRAGKWRQRQFARRWQKVVLDMHRRIDANLEVFRFKGVDMSAAVKVFVEQGLTREMHRINARVEAVEKVFMLKKPVACLSQHALGLSYALGEICRDHDIPGLLISHGSHTAQTSEQARIEWDVHGRTLFNSHYPFVAIQSPFAKQFYDQQQMLSQAVDTGPLLLAGRIETDGKTHAKRNSLFGNHSRETILLHAGTPKTWRAFRPWVYETVDEYVQNIIDLIQAVEAVHGLYLAIRFRPMQDLTLKEFQQLLPVSESYGIYPEGSFADYLLSSDMLVSYSSTTIEEALQNDIPVLQYDPQDKYCHIAGQKLDANGAETISPVYYIGSREDLVAGMSWLKSQHLDTDANKLLNWSNYRMESVEISRWLGDMGVACD
jgi:hypothetical protein